ncbi:MAG: transporter substrate-binding protein [Chloroflexi bacterium]|uniref:Transporter substrate-binding protein n=1 Tax=Candidatus Chlorohelix allophototropha TaxID=3003348 RepID=A0A8T7LYX6_9CHLR|nr:transporter substrate-binding protein [Chloroflexota bacterium]WJW67385.1 transporter substrate-binding protein [Chloroflexota bacterium L227-S17]
MFRFLRMGEKRVKTAFGFLVLTLLMANLALSACGDSTKSATTDDKSDIAVGSLLDETGPLNIYGKPMADAAKLAIKDINNNGGVLGRKLKLVSYDTQSDTGKYTQLTTQIIQQDKVAVLMGGITSAAREAIRPIVDRNKQLYFYNVQYEGGVCDKNTFLTENVPTQQLIPLTQWGIKNVGPKIYVLAADYNFGQISTDWVKQYAAQFGGQVIGTDFVPLDVSEFGSIISKLQDAKPDIVFSILVGGNHIAFYRQFAAAGLGAKMKIISSTFGVGNEQIVLSPAESKDIVVAYPYFQELTNPTNQKFVKMWQDEYGKDYPYITDLAEATWNSWHIWAEAVKKANSLDREKVTAEIEKGLTWDAPRGTVQMDGPTHHATFDITIARANDKKGFNLIETQKAVPPAFEQQVCNLVKNPETYTQFTPGQK